MKKYTLLILLCITLHVLGFAQVIPNFYNTKKSIDSSYQRIIQSRGIENMQGTDYNPYQRWLNHWEPILYPHGDFSIERQNLEKYISEYQNGIFPEHQSLNTLNWKHIGPDKMPDGTKTWSKGLGQIHYLAFDPNDRNNNKIFACSPAGGLWKSIDGGDNWINAGTDKGLPLCGVSSVAIDPDNSETNWFVSTGNGEPMPGRFWAQDAIGVWRTTTGGADWELIGLESVHQMRKIILTYCQAALHLFVASTSGVYECEDGLANDPQWTQLVSGNYYDIEFDVQNNGIIYASGTGSNSTIYTLDWVNDNYTELPNLSSIPQESGRRLIIEISSAAPQYLFIAATYWNNDNYSYLYRYDLFNNEILYKGEFETEDDIQPGIGPERAMGWTLSPVLNASGDLSLVYGNTAPIFIANNLLDNDSCAWSKITSSYYAHEIHVDQHYMKFTPDGQTLWVANDGGVFKTAMPDLINNWEEKNNGLAVATIHHMATSDINKSVALSGAYDCGSNMYVFNNDDWHEKQVKQDDGFQCHFSWDDPDMLWVSTQDSLWGSFNGGQDFLFLSTGFHWHSFFIQNMIYPEKLYGTNEQGVSGSADYGDTFQAIASYPGVTNNKTWRVAGSPTDGNYIYSSWYGNSSGNPQKVFKSTTEGGITSGCWEDIGSPLDNRWVSSIAVDYFNPDHIWVATNSFVYDVNTVTHQWTDISNGLPSYISIKIIKQLYGAEGQLYAGTNYGLYYFNEDNGFWQYVDGNLPNATITDIQIDIDKNRIAVGTFGRGVWEAQLLTTGINDYTMNSGEVCGLNITVKPNPARKWAAFNYTLPQEMTAGIITITDATGKTIEILEVKSNQGQKLWDIRSIESGIYFYTLKASGFSKSGKLVISK